MGYRDKLARVHGSAWLDIEESTKIVYKVDGPRDAPFADVTFFGPVELGLTMSRETARRCRDLLNEALTEIDRKAGPE
jgi:hypothetical protein